MTLVYLDEVGFAMKGVVRRTWSMKGQTPLVDLPAKWDKLSTIGAITSGGKFFQNTHQGAIRSTQVIDFLKHVLSHVPGELIVVLDNARIHHARRVQDFVQRHQRLSFCFLPPYAPELNPIERIWAYLKSNVLANFCPLSLSNLKEKLQLGWQRVRYIGLPSQLMP